MHATTERSLIDLQRHILPRAMDGISPERVTLGQALYPEQVTTAEGKSYDYELPFVRVMLAQASGRVWGNFNPDYGVLFSGMDVVGSEESAEDAAKRIANEQLGVRSTFVVDMTYFDRFVDRDVPVRSGADSRYTYVDDKAILRRINHIDHGYFPQLLDIMRGSGHSDPDLKFTVTTFVGIYDPIGLEVPRFEDGELNVGRFTIEADMPPLHSLRNQLTGYDPSRSADQIHATVDNPTVYDPTRSLEAIAAYGHFLRHVHRHTNV